MTVDSLPLENYPSLIKACKPEQWRKAIALLDELHDAQACSSLGPNPYAVSAAVTVCGKAGRWPEALALFESVEHPDQPLWHAVLGALSRNRRGAEAEALLSQMETEFDGRSLNLALHANRDNWRGCVRVMCQAKRWVRGNPEAAAVAAVGSEGGRFPELSASVTVVRACADAGRFALAKHFLSDARASFLTGDPRFNDSNELDGERAAASESLESHSFALWRQFTTHRLSCIHAALVTATPTPPAGTAANTEGGDSGHPVFAASSLHLHADPTATAALDVALSLAATEGAMPSFAHAGARAGYTIAKLGPRSCRVADFLTAVDSRLSPSTNYFQQASNEWLTGAVAGVLSPTRGGGGGGGGEESGACRVLSLGSGPGFDMVGAALVCEYLDLDLGLEEEVGGLSPDEAGLEDLLKEELLGSQGNGAKRPRRKVEATVLDFEPGWAHAVAAVEHATNAGLSTTAAQEPRQNTALFGHCDITLPLAHPSNAAVVEALAPTLRVGDTRSAGHSKVAGGDLALIVCSYVVAENAKALRASDFEFFRALAEALPMAEVGSDPNHGSTILLFTETTHRLWPDILAACLRGIDNEEEHSNEQRIHGCNGNTSSAAGNYCAVDVVFPQIHGKRGAAMAIRKRKVFVQSGHHASTSHVSSLSPTISSSSMSWLEGAVTRRCIPSSEERNGSLREESVTQTIRLLRQFQRDNDGHERRLIERQKVMIDEENQRASHSLARLERKRGLAEARKIAQDPKEL